MSNQPLKLHVEGRLASLRMERDQSWLPHWSELAKFILPRRFRWFITVNASNKGSPINAQILDSTGTIAARNLAAGMMSGITSPTRPWFKLRAPGTDTDASTPVSLWLSEVERRMMRVFSESNFYNSIAVVYFDLVVFGTAVMIIYEDFEDVIRCYVPCAGEYFVANSDRLAVDTIYREFVLSVKQIVEWFGKENVSEATRLVYERGGAELGQERVIAHAIEPNTEIEGAPAKVFKFREVYWEVGAVDIKENEDAQFLRVKGFREWPGLCPRWDLSSNDSYGRSPGMDALPDIKQLQQETKRKAQAIDKMVNPPLLGDIQLKNQPASTLPGAITYVSGLSTGNSAGMKPIYQVNPYISDLQNDIAEVQARIRVTFHNDLFLMISELQTVRTATEIDARREEKLVLLGPVLERFENEALDPAINRTFNIMLRGGLLPPPPPELEGKEIQVEYVSMLATAQRATATAGIERLLAVTGNIIAGQAAAGAIPDALDKVDIDMLIDEYSSQLGVAPKLIRDSKAVAALRQQRAEAMNQQAALESTNSIADSAKTLSQTEVGGGLNALEAIVGGGP